jgi:hypothetical protein
MGAFVQLSDFEALLVPGLTLNLIVYLPLFSVHVAFVTSAAERVLFLR